MELAKKVCVMVILAGLMVFSGLQCAMECEAEAAFFPLHVAVQVGDVAEVERLLDANEVDIHVKDDTGHTLFYVACMDERIALDVRKRLAQMLYRAGADDKSIRFSDLPQEIASSIVVEDRALRAKADAAYQLLSEKENPFASYLIPGLVACVKEYNGDLHTVITHPMKLRESVPAKKAGLCLKEAIRRGDERKTLEALYVGANLEGLTLCNDLHKATPLGVAAHYSQLGVARVLLEQKADVEGCAMHSDMPWLKGWDTPLHEAACRLNKDMAELLLNHGANLEARNAFDHATPLHCSAICSYDKRNAQKELIKFLLDRGANINATNKNGNTPLLMMVDANDLDLVQFWVEQGADVRARSMAGLTCLEHAKKMKKDPRIIAVLVKAENRRVAEERRLAGEKDERCVLS